MISNILARLNWHPAKGTQSAAGLVILGFLLSDFNEGFLALAALGTFGPGVLRELGFLNDQDEFQRRAAHRAGYHAFLVAGFTSFLLAAYLRSGHRNAGDPEVLVTLILAILWLTWFISSLLSYWGPQKTVNRLLNAFGVV